MLVEGDVQIGMFSNLLMVLCPQLTRLDGCKRGDSKVGIVRKLEGD
jgi:hypothetical protein